MANKVFGHLSQPPDERLLQPEATNNITKLSAIDSRLPDLGILNERYPEFLQRMGHLARLRSGALFVLLIAIGFAWEVSYRKAAVAFEWDDDRKARNVMGLLIASGELDEIQREIELTYKDNVRDEDEEEPGGDLPNEMDQDTDDDLHVNQDSEEEFDEIDVEQEAPAQDIERQSRRPLNYHKRAVRPSNANKQAAHSPNIGQHGELTPSVHQRSRSTPKVTRAGAEGCERLLQHFAATDKFSETMDKMNAQEMTHFTAASFIEDLQSLGINEPLGENIRTIQIMLVDTLASPGVKPNQRTLAATLLRGIIELREDKNEASDRHHMGLKEEREELQWVREDMENAIEARQRAESSG